MAILLVTRGAAGLTLEVETQLGSNGVFLHLTARNDDTAAVERVAPEVVYQHRTYTGELAAAVLPGNERAWDIVLAAPPGPGAFPIVVRTRYAEAGGRARSAVLARVVRTPGAPPTGVRATLAAHPVSDHTTLALTLENQGAAAVGGRVSVVLPDEFSIEPESEPAHVVAGGRTDVPLVVENHRAPPGTAAPVFTLFEYEEDGRHQAVLAGTTLEVASDARARVPLMVGGAATLLMLAVAVAAVRRTAARPRG